MTFTDNVLFLKLCWTRALNHINFPKSIIEMGLLIYLTLKASEASSTMMVLALISCFSFIIFCFWLGYWDIRHGIMEKETSLSNQFNPEIQHLIKASTAKKEG